MNKPIIIPDVRKPCFTIEEDRIISQNDIEFSSMIDWLIKRVVITSSTVELLSFKDLFHLSQHPLSYDNILIVSIKVLSYDGHTISISCRDIYDKRTVTIGHITLKTNP